MTTRAPLLGEPGPVELMNTIWADRYGVYDALATTPEATAWMAAMQPTTQLPVSDALSEMDGPEREPTVVRLRHLRDALRDLAADLTHDPRPDAARRTRSAASAVAELNRAAAVGPRYRELSWPQTAAPDGPAFEVPASAPPASRPRSVKPIPQAFISELADTAIELFATPSRERLRACLAPGCVLYFVKQHPRREWCSAGCGNRARVSRHYQRHHARRDDRGHPPNEQDRTQ